MAGVASLWYFLGIKGAEGEGWKQVCFMLIVCLSIPFLTGLVYMTSIWNIATVIAILEEDYGKKALLKSMKLIRASFNGPEGEGRYKLLAFVISLSVPFFIGLMYITSVWNIAMVISVLEKSHGTKAMVKSIKLIKGKIWVSCAVFLALEIIFAGITFTYSLLVVAGDILDLVGEVFVGIVCYMLATVLIHFSLVIQTVVYFVCKAYHNEDISNVAAHLDVAYVNLVRGNDDH
ncbi:uncharacterized protein LOC113336049 [Papaver somniferum]|uniref:uncharacterized protein LOC113336049 n=1 Tax=Papaver somniferum TaxID=3469 RepID=UPI000E6FAAEA|nr:uncharacterized protein LOC113336049 [Papaver somniferum]